MTIYIYGVHSSISCTVLTRIISDLNPNPNPCPIHPSHSHFFDCCTMGGRKGGISHAFILGVICFSSFFTAKIHWSASTSSTLVSSKMKEVDNLIIKMDEIEGKPSVPISKQPPCHIHHDSAANKTTCCAPWDINIDEWWTINFEWRVGPENRTHYCIERITDSDQLRFLGRVHDLQWHSNCSDTWAAAMPNSGYAAGITSAIKGFLSAMDAGRPFQIARRKAGSAWRFAPDLSTIPPGVDCKSRDLYCYFLSITRCTPKVGAAEGYRKFIGKKYPANHTERVWLTAYLTRPKRWTRKYMYRYSNEKLVGSLKAPCAVLHVRRTDVLLEKHWRQRRHYFPVADYLKVVNASSNILLLTDDQSAVDEALQLHSHLDWTFINRTRFYGTGGGMNNHLPSNNPLLETIVILLELKLAERCHTMVHTKSGFVFLLTAAMSSSTPDNLKHQIRIDEGRQPTEIYTQTAEAFFKRVRPPSPTLA